MIAYLSGKVIEKSPLEVVLDVHGVGYVLTVSAATAERLPAIGAELSLLVHTNVREDAIVLFGFLSQEERAVFRLLINISGVGPKMAIGILSSMGAAELRENVVRNNIVALTAISGVGRKTAERLVIELRDKLAKMEFTGPALPDNASNVRTEALLALTSLGYSRPIAEAAVRKALAEFGEQVPSVEIIVKTALRHANA